MPNQRKVSRLEILQYAKIGIEVKLAEANDAETTKKLMTHLEGLEFRLNVSKAKAGIPWSENHLGRNAFGSVRPKLKIRSL